MYTHTVVGDGTGTGCHGNREALMCQVEEDDDLHRGFANSHSCALGPLNFPCLFRSDGSLRRDVGGQEADDGVVQRPPCQLCFCFSAAATVARHDCDRW